MGAEKESLPVDKGWAWIIVLACGALFAISAGANKCHGVILVELVERFDGVYKPSSLLWVFTASFVCDGILAPLQSYIIIKIGHRWSAFLGLFSLAVGYIGLAYSPSLPTMLVCYSIPAGFGQGIVYVTAILASSPYFSKRKALAVGLITSGSGIGTIALPPILRFLFDEFGFSGAMLIYGGLCLQLLCLGALLRPFSYYSKWHSTGDTSLSAPEMKDDTKIKLPKKVKENEQRNEMFDYSSKDRVPEDLITTAANSSTATADDSNTTADDSNYTTADDSNSTANECNSFAMASNAATKDSNDIGSKKLVNMNDATNVEAKEKFNWRVILMPKMIMVSLSMVVYLLGLAVSFTCIPALAKESDVSDYVVSAILSLTGVIEIPCRIANGMLADKKIMTATMQYTICIFLAGFFCLLCALISGLPGVVLGVIGISAFGTSVFSLLPLVFSELLGEINVTSSLGLQGPSATASFIVATTIAGLIYDATGSWRYVFYFISSMMMASSLITWPYLILHRYRQSKVRQQPGDVRT